MVRGGLPEAVVTSPLHFARFEFKYVLRAQKRREVESDLLYFLEYDPFVQNRDNHRYFVRSLYFDDPNFTAFHDKIDGLHSRSKFRLRTYAFDFKESVPIFLEIKGRHNNLVFKHRTPVQREGTQWSTLSGEDLITILLDKAEKSEVLDQFSFDLYRKNLQPVALIDYERRPYISRYDPDFRLTFDEQLTAVKTMSLFPGDCSTSRKMIAGYTVLEVKFRHHMPSWFHQVIQAHELRRISISKIVTGMETLDMAFDEN
jgi:SPX domain protein involved in polyphosphate accumulation